MWIGATIAVGVVTGVLMVLLGMEPRLVLVGFVVLIVSAVTWLFVDLGTVAVPVTWHGHGATDIVSARSDRRVQVLTARLRSPVRRSRSAAMVEHGHVESNDEISDTLVSVIDDHLVAEHGIDRSIDATSAAETLGPALTRFVTDPESRRSMSRRRNLARTITLIEDFTAPPDSVRPETSPQDSGPQDSGRQHFR